MARPAILLAIILLTGCQSSPDLSLRDDSNDAAEARRRRMNITIRRALGTGWSEPEEMSQDDFDGELEAHCLALVRASSTFATCDLTTIDSCDEAVCDAHVRTCMANIYLELSRTVAPVEIEGLTGTIQISPQGTATNAGFDEQALAAATDAITQAGENLGRAADPSFTSPTAHCFTPGSIAKEVNNTEGQPTETYAESFASTLVEGTQLARQASDQALRDNIAVADADLIAIPNRAEATRTAWLANTLSRLHGLQIIMGGMGYNTDTWRTAELDDVAAAGVCTVRCQTKKCQLARELLGASGMNPGDLLNFNVPVTDLINGIGLLTAGGLKYRFAERYGAPEVATLTAPEFLDRFGLTENDFDRAREFLRGEASFFDRDMTVQTARPILATTDPEAPPVTSQYDYYAATVHRPRQTPGMYHISMARANFDYIDDRLNGVNSAEADSARPTPAYAGRGMAQLLDYAQSVSQFVVSKNTLGDSVSDIAGVMLAHRITTGAVRVENCYRFYNNMDWLRVRVHGMDDAASVTLVDGTAGLTCAETGLVEGEPCNMADYVVPNVTETPVTHSNYALGFDRYLEMSKSDLVYPNTFRYYVVRLREGAADDAAGNWEGLTSITTNYVGASSNIWRFCHNESFDPVLTRTASIAMQADPTECDAGPANDCYGLPLNPRLPLEDELIDNADPWENSFRHHL